MERVKRGNWALRAQALSSVRDSDSGGGAHSRVKVAAPWATAKSHNTCMGNGQNIQCETHFDITGWTAQAGVLTIFTGAPDFFVNSGTITVNPANATQTCALFLSAAGFNVVVTAPGTLTINGPSDMALPAALGHYSLSGMTLEGVSYTELQIQVSQK